MGAVADGEEVKTNPDGELALGALLLASPVEEIALGAALGAMANPSKGNGDGMKRSSNPTTRKLVSKLESLRPKLAKVADKVYQACRKGVGTGICFDIAAAMRDALRAEGVEAYVVSEPGHKWVIATDWKSAAKVDIQPTVYESRVSFSTAKRPGKFDVKEGVRLLPRHVEVHALPADIVLAGLRQSIDYKQEYADLRAGQAGLRVELQPDYYMAWHPDWGASPGYVSNPTKAGEITIKTHDGKTFSATPVASYGDVVVIVWNKLYNVTYVPGGLAVMAEVRLKKDAVDAARFYGKEPEGVKLLSQALSGDRDARKDISTRKSLSAWKDRGKKTEKRVYQPKYWVLVNDDRDPFGINGEAEELQLDSLDDAVAYVLGIQDRLEASEGKFVMVEIEERIGNVRKSVLLHKRFREKNVFVWYEWTNMDRTEVHVIRPPVPRGAKIPY